MPQPGLRLPETSRADGGFPVAFHLDMVRDTQRVAPFRKAIAELIKPGMRVLECGCGSGILSIIAAKQGAHVVAVEGDAQIAAQARRNFERAGVNVELLVGNVLDAEIPTDDDAKFDVIIAEMMSTWCIDEPQIAVANRMRSFLRPGGVFIPDRISNLVAVGNFQFGNDEVEIRAPYIRLTGIPDATLVTETRLASTIDLYSDHPKTMSGGVEFTCLAGGILNCVQISSIVQLTHGINFYSSNTLMPTTIVPLLSDLTVQTGTRIELEFQYEHGSNIRHAKFAVRQAGT